LDDNDDGGSWLGGLMDVVKNFLDGDDGDDGETDPIEHHSNGYKGT